MINFIKKYSKSLLITLIITVLISMFLLIVFPYQKSNLLLDSESNNSIKLKSKDKYESVIKIKDNFVEGLEIYNADMKYYFHYTSSPFVLKIKIIDGNEIFYQETFTQLEQGRAMLLFKKPLINYKDKELKIIFEVEKSKESINLLLNKGNFIRVDQISKENNFTILIYLFGIFTILMAIFSIKYINYEKLSITKNKVLKFLKIPIYFILNILFALLSLYMIYKAHYLNYIPAYLLLTNLILLTLIIVLAVNIIKNSEGKVEKWFLAIAIPISCLFCIFLLPNDGQDGCRHYGAIYGYVTKQDISTGKVEIPDDIHIHRNDITSLEQFFKIIKSDYSYESTRTIKIAKYSMLNYIFSIPTVYIAKLLNLHPYLGWYLAKIVNMIMTITISYFIIKRIPKYKKLIMTYILMPYFIYQYVCLPTDLIINLSTLVLLSIGLDYYFNPRKIKIIDWIILIFSSIAMNISKPIYWPLILIIIFLMRKSIKTNKKNIIYMLISLLLPIVCYCFIQTTHNNNVQELITKSINTNSLGINYLINHPIQGILGLIKQFMLEGDEYLLNLIGWKFNWAGGKLPYYIPVLYLIILLFSALIPNYNENKKMDKLTLIYTLIISLGVMSLLMLFWMYCEVQSDIFIDKMYGLNGRYCIPIFIFTLISFSNIDILKNKKSDIVKYDKFLLISICVVAFIYVFNLIELLFV